MKAKIETLSIEADDIHGRASRKAMMAYANALVEDAASEEELGYAARLFSLVADASEKIIASKAQPKVEFNANLEPTPILSGTETR